MISTQKSDKKNRPFCPRGSSPSILEGELTSETLTIASWPQATASPKGAK